MTTVPFSQKLTATYNRSYDQTVRAAMERGWSAGLIRGLIDEWSRARSEARWEADYLEHICGLMDALADMLVARGIGVIWRSKA